MYSTGTVTATANSTKLVGTGTKWLNNINRVSAEQAIQVQIGSTVHNNSIQSIQSDTELTLNFPLPVAATGAKYVILTTMVHSVSDAMNKIVSMNGANVQFSDILTCWMTEQGIITVTLPDQTIQQLRTTKEMDKQLDGKLNSSGNISLTKGVLTIFNPLSSLLRLVVDEDNSNYISFFKNGKTDSANRTAVIGYGDKDIEEFQITNSKVNRTIGIHRGGVRISGKGEILTAGEFGFGGSAVITLTDDLKKEMVTKVFKQGGGTGNNIFSGHGAGINFAYTPQIRMGLFIRSNGDTRIYTSRDDTDDGELKMTKLYSEVNTTKDANGNLKAASPIIRVFADHVDPNEEAEGVTLKKLHTGIYQLHGVLGLHSDASWGGINGGITIPCGINQLPLVYVLYDVLEKGEQHPFDGSIVEPDEDGDIVLYTTYRKHDLPQNIQYERFKLYPEFLKEVDGEKVELTPGEPCDIPVGHWVDVRVNMPSNSIYNQKQAEAERLAKIEAERLAEMDIDV